MGESTELVTVQELVTKPVAKRVKAREYEAPSPEVKEILAEAARKLRGTHSATLNGLTPRQAALLHLEARPKLNLTEDAKAALLGVAHRKTLWRLRRRVPDWGARRTALALELLDEYLPDANRSLVDDLASFDPKARAAARAQLYQLKGWIKTGSQVNVTQNTDNRRVECPPEVVGIALAELVRLAEAEEPAKALPAAQPATQSTQEGKTNAD